MTVRDRVLSGMRPSGTLHLGNYLGALANWVKLQDDHDCFYFSADWHVLTDDLQTGDVPQNTIDMTVEWLGAGLDPERSTLFIQSQVPEHAELHLLFSMVTPVSWLERVPTYRERIEQQEITSPSYGLLGYPLLQSADILMYKPKWVPVGADQAHQVHVDAVVVADGVVGEAPQVRARRLLHEQPDRGGEGPRRRHRAVSGHRAGGAGRRTRPLQRDRRRGGRGSERSGDGRQAHDHRRPWLHRPQHAGARREALAAARLTLQRSFDRLPHLRRGRGRKFRLMSPAPSGVVACWVSPV